MPAFCVTASPPGHRLILLRDDTPDLIEVTTVGSRDRLQRPIHLSQKEQEYILASGAIAGTQWRLADLPVTVLFAKHRAQVVQQALVIMLVFVAVSLVMLCMVRRAEQQRQRAEQSLRESHEQLEERARRLAELNGELQHEISERIQAERQMRKLSGVVEQTDDLVLITDHRGLVEYVNPAFENKTGYRAEEVLGNKPGLIRSGRHDAAFYKNMWSIIRSGEVFRGLFINCRKDGSLFYEQKTITPLKDEQGHVSHFVATGKDVTEQIEAQERLRHMAHHDVLTDLPNRALLLDRLHLALARARRNDGLVAVLLLDLDRFKAINDSLGHSAGDELLKTVAERLRRCVRSCDTVARLGGDEFILVLENIGAAGDAGIVAGKVLRTVARTCRLDSHVLQTTASIGITLHPLDGDCIETLLKNADAAMYRAKHAGGNGHVFFTCEMSDRAAPVHS